MSDAPGHGPSTPTPGGFDNELNYRAIWKFTIFIAAVTLAAIGLMWVLASALKKDIADRQAPPPVLAGARTQPLPPAPRLESNPPKDLAEFRQRENAVLDTYAWVDKEKGAARIPVDRAIDILSAKGLPVPPTATPGPAPTPGAAK
jgi:hypothetical protein